MSLKSLHKVRPIKLNFEDLSEYFPLIPTFFAEMPPVLAFFPVVLSITMSVKPNDEDG